MAEGDLSEYGERIALKLILALPELTKRRIFLRWSFTLFWIGRSRHWSPLIDINAGSYVIKYLWKKSESDNEPMS